LGTGVAILQLATLWAQFQSEKHLLKISATIYLQVHAFFKHPIWQFINRERTPNPTQQCIDSTS